MHATISARLSEIFFAQSPSSLVSGIRSREVSTSISERGENHKKSARHVLVILNVVGTIAALSITLGAIAEQRFRRSLAVEPAHEALVYECLGSSFGLGLITTPTVAMFPLTDVFATQK